MLGLSFGFLMGIGVTGGTVVLVVGNDFVGAVVFVSGLEGVVVVAVAAGLEGVVVVVGLEGTILPRAISSNVPMF